MVLVALNAGAFRPRYKEEVAAERKFPAPWIEKIDPGVVVPTPTNPLPSTINKGVEVPMSPITNTGVVVPCVSTDKVPQGLVVPMPTLPMIVESIVRMGTAVVEVAMEKALMALVGIVDVEEDA